MSAAVFPERILADDLRELNDSDISARFLDVSKPTVGRMIARGDLPSIKVGNCRRIPRCVLLAVANGIDPWQVFHDSQQQVRDGRVELLSESR